MEPIYKSLSRVRALVVFLIIAVVLFSYGIIAAITTASETLRAVSELAGLISLSLGVGCMGLLVHKHSMQKIGNATHTKKLQSDVMHKIIGLNNLTRDMQNTMKQSLGVMDRSVNKNNESVRANSEFLHEHLVRSNSTIAETNKLITNLSLETIRSISVTNRSINNSAKIADEKITEILSDISAIKKNNETERNQVLQLRNETKNSIGMTNRSIVDLRKSNQNTNKILTGELQQLLEAAEIRQLILLQEMYRSLNMPEEFEVPVEINNES